MANITVAEETIQHPIDELRLTIWRGGLWKVWYFGDAVYAETDPDWLATLSVEAVLKEIERCRY